MPYDVFAHTDREYSVVEKPTGAQQKAFNRLRCKATHVNSAVKAQIAEAMGFDESVISEEYDYLGWCVKTANLIFEDCDVALSDSARDNVYPQDVEEGCEDFIGGSRSSQSEQSGSLSDLMSALTDLSDMSTAET